MSENLAPPSNRETFLSQEEQAGRIREEKVGAVRDPKEKSSETSAENEANLVQDLLAQSDFKDHPLQDKIDKLCKGLPVDQIPSVHNNPEASEKAHQLLQQKQQRLRLLQEQSPQKP